MDLDDSPFDLEVFWEILMSAVVKARPPRQVLKRFDGVEVAVEIAFEIEVPPRRESMDFMFIIPIATVLLSPLIASAVDL